MEDDVTMRRAVKPNGHRRRAPRLRISGDVPPRPHMPSWRAQAQFYTSGNMDLTNVLYLKLKKKKETSNVTGTAACR